MAVSTESYFSNAIVGVPQVAAGQVNVYKEDTTPRFAIGTKFERQDGAVFRYAHFGATVSSAGLVCHVDISESSPDELTSVVVASSSTYQMPDEQPGVYPNMKGSKYLVITKGSITASDYAGGYITIVSGPSAASGTYRIKDNTATGTPDSGNIRVELYDKLNAGLNSSTALKVTGSRWANLEASLPSTGSDLPAGISMITITTADDFGWVQTKGIVGVLSGESTILANRAVGMSTETAGAVDVVRIHQAGDITSLVRDLVPVVGFSCDNSTATTFVPIVVNLE